MSAQHRLRRVLHATDFSAASRAAFGRAVDLARRDGGTLLLFHVLTPPSPFAPPGRRTPPTYLTLLASARRAAEARLSAALARARAAGARALARMVEGGGAAEHILKAARGWPADVVVIGTHGRSGVSRFFMGSVAETVVRRAACPVLTVRGR